jgi:Holliday junction resolvase RusA-like endonuclease
MKFRYYLRPITLNHAIKTSFHGGFPRKYKTKDLINFERDFEIQSMQYKNEIKEFRSKFNQNKNVVHLKINYYVRSICNNQGQFKLRSGDLDNWNKYTIDSLSKIFGFNDALVKRLECEKFNHYEDIIEIEIIAI